MRFGEESDAARVTLFFLVSILPLSWENQCVKPRVRAAPDKPLGFDALTLSH